jgi:hypothetical protein
MMDILYMRQKCEHAVWGETGVLESEWELKQLSCT